MNTDLLIVLIILLVNLIVSVIYLILHLKKQQRVKGLIVFVFMLVFPIVGFVFIFLAELINYIAHRRSNKEINLEELSFNKERMKIVTDADVETSLNQVPIEEALIISGKEGKRKAFINLLKTDEYESTLSTVRNAVENADLEVAHYAASFVTDVIAKNKEKEKKLRKKMEETGDQSDVLEYIRFVSEMLKPDILSITEIRIYVKTLDQAAESIYEKKPKLLPVNCIRTLVNVWYYAGNEDKALKWVNVARSLCREDIECFKICAAYYFKTGDRDNLIKLIDETKRLSSLQLDNEALEIIRFYRKSR